MSKEAKKLGGTTSVRSETAKRPVYKSVIGSPFILQWPKVQAELGQTILTHLLKTLEPVGEFRKKCKAHKKQPKGTPLSASKPEIYDRIHAGINQVTRYLESYIEKKSDKQPLIYICKREIKPLQLCQHLLYMAAVANVKIITMPADSELKIGKALCITKASVVLVEAIEDKEDSLIFDAKQVPAVDAPWLSSLNKQPKYETNYVKTIQTTVPLPNNTKRKIAENQGQNKKAKLN